MSDNSKSGANIGDKAASAAGRNSSSISYGEKKADKSSAIKKVVAIKAVALLLAVVLVITPILFLFALPTMMFEAVMSFVEMLKESFRNMHWEQTMGVNFITALKNAAANIWSETVGLWWQWFKNKIAGDDRNYSDIDKDKLGDNAEELRVTYEETSQKQTLMECVTATEDAYEARVEEMKEEITDPSGPVYPLVQQWGAARYSAEYGGQPQWYAYQGLHQSKSTAYETLEDASADTQRTYYVYGGATISVTSSKMTDINAARIMAINTVTKGASLQDMALSDYQKWLGYNPHEIDIWGWWPWRVRKYSVPIDIGLGSNNPRVDRWIGTCLPQYLQDQVKFENNKFGGVVSDSISSQSFAATDLCIQVDASDITAMSGSPSGKTVVETRWYKDTEMPGIPSPISIHPVLGEGEEELIPLRYVIDGSGGGFSGTTPPPSKKNENTSPATPKPTPKPTSTPVPTPRIVYHQKDFTFNVVYVTYSFSISIKPRDPETILDLLGFTGTEFASEVQAAGGHTGMVAQPPAANPGGQTAQETVPPAITPEPTFNPAELPEEVAPESSFQPDSGAAPIYTDPAA